MTATFVNDISTAICPAAASSIASGTSTRAFTAARPCRSTISTATVAAKSASEKTGRETPKQKVADED